MTCTVGRNISFSLLVAYLLTGQFAGCAESFRQVNLAELGYEGPRLAGLKGEGHAIVRVKFDGRSLQVRAIRKNYSFSPAPAFDDLEIDPANGQVLSIKPVPIVSGPSSSNQWTPAYGAAFAEAERQRRNFYHPNAFGRSVLTTNGAGVLLLKTDGGEQHTIYSPQCSENERRKDAGLGLYTFFLDEQHIYLDSCGTAQVISPSGERLYKIRSLFPTGLVVRRSKTVAALNPSSTTLGALLLAPEDSATVYAFCLSNGRTLLKEHWAEASWDILDVSPDGTFVALAGKSSVRIYRVNPEPCSR